MSSSSTSSTSSYAVSSSSAGGVLRITGLNSGIDVDSVVKSMLTADQTRIDKAKQSQQLLQWKQEAYQSIITDIKSLQSSYFDITDTTNCLTSSNSYNSLTATSTDSSIVTGTASSTAVQGTYKLNVANIAKSAVVSGTSINGQIQLGSDLSGWSNKNISFDINGDTENPVTITIPSLSTGTLASEASELVTDINNAISSQSSLSGNISASLVNDGTNYYVKFTTSGSSTISIDSSNTTVADLSSVTNLSTNSNTQLTSLVSDASTLKQNLVLNLRYDGKDIAVTLDNTGGSKTINDLATAINTATGGGVTAKIDDITGKFVLQTKDTGSTASLQIESTATIDGTTTNTTDALVNALGLGSTLDQSAQKGTDANLTITQPDGTEATLTETSNKFTINGVTYNLVSSGSTSLSVTSNVDAIYDKIKTFLDKYNSLVDEIQTKLTEKKDYDYPPLTDAQKSEMSDSQITAWETKAKAGVLRDDNNLQDLLDNLRSAFTSPVTTDGTASGTSITSLHFGSTGSSAIGIDTSDDYNDGDKITITDSQKLKDALADDPDQIIKLFTNSSTSTDTTTKFYQSGIFQRISSILQDNVGVVNTSLNSATLTKYANLQDDYSAFGGMGSTIPDQIYTQQLLITQLTDTYNDDQTKYYNQFSALETAMEQLSAQQSVISSYFS